MDALVALDDGRIAGAKACLLDLLATWPLGDLAGEREEGEGAHAQEEARLTSIRRSP